MKLAIALLSICCGCAFDVTQSALPDDPGTREETGGWEPAPDASEPLIPPEALALAIEVTAAELEYQGYANTIPPVHVTQHPVSYISAEHGKGGAPVYGFYRRGRIWIGEGSVCDYPADYDGRLLGGVLSHELTHAAGFDHGREMTALTRGMWVRWLVACDLPIPDQALDETAERFPLLP